MICEIREIVPFQALLSINLNPLDFLGILLERMKLQLNSEAAALKYIKIRPWWFDDDIEPRGLVVVLIGEI